MKKIVAWVVVCGKGEIYSNLYWNRKEAEEEAREGDRLNECAPHSVVKLTGIVKGGRRKPQGKKA